MKKTRGAKPVNNLADARWQKEAPDHEKSAAGTRLVKKRWEKYATLEERRKQVPRNGGRPPKKK